MEVKLTEKNGVLIAEVEGEINITTSPELKKKFDKIEDSRIIFNLSQVRYIDSSGLATLVEILKKAKGRGGSIHLTHLSEKVRGLFEITKLDKLFGIYQDEQTALEQFSS